MINKEEVPQPETVIQGPGQILKKARERAKLSCQDIADKMKLRKSLIEDIEQNNFDVNISLTFIRGYLKLYAKHVQVSEAEILNAFESLTTKKKEPAKLQSFSRRVANQANDDKLMLVTYLVVAVVIALVVIWWFQQSSNDTTAASNEINNPESVTQDVIAKEELPLKDTSSLIENRQIDDTGVATSEVQLASVIEEQEIENQAIDSNATNNTHTLDSPAVIIETKVTETAAPVELIFEFSGDCWMNLADATGENIAYGVKINGRIMPVTGIPPFVVTLGAPEVVKISYAGETIDMTFLPSGRIAKFELPLT